MSFDLALVGTLNEFNVSVLLDSTRAQFCISLAFVETYWLPRQISGGPHLGAATMTVPGEVATPTLSGVYLSRMGLVVCTVLHYDVVLGRDWLDLSRCTVSRGVLDDPVTMPLLPVHWCSREGSGRFPLAARLRTYVPPPAAYAGQSSGSRGLAAAESTDHAFRTKPFGEDHVRLPLVGSADFQVASAWD